MRGRLNRIGVVAFASSLALSLLGSCSMFSSNNGGGTPSVPDTSSIFAKYGINTSLEKNPVDANGDALASDYNPFNKSVVRLKPRREIFFSGMYSNGSLANLLDDYDTGSQPSNSSMMTYANPVFAQKPHASAAGDIDGDHKDEVVTVYFNSSSNSIAVGKNTGPAYLCIEGMKDTIIPAQSINGGAAFNYYISSSDKLQGRMSIAMGDIDGDGRQEIAIAVGDTFMILDDQKASFKTLLGPIDYRSASEYSGGWATCPWWTKIASGDINGDGRDEFVAISGYWIGGDNTYKSANYYVYGGSTPALLDSDVVMDKGGKEILFGNVAIGDLDNDGVGEICFSGISKRATNTLTNLEVIMARWKDSHLVMSGGGDSLAINLDGGRDQYRPLPSFCITPVLNQKQSLVAVNNVIAYDSSKLAITSTLPQNASVAPDYLANFEQVMAGGDVDRDGEEEIVALYMSDPKTLKVYKTAGATGTLTPSATVSCDNSYSYGTGSNGVYQSLCLPDWDGDAITLQYEDNHTLEFTQPTVITVIASPPFWSSLLSSDSYSNYSTSYGTSQGSSVEETNSFTVSAEFSFAGSWSDAGVTAELGVAAGISSGLGYGTSTEKSSTQTVTTIAGQDKVVFTSVPLDVYKYTVLTAPDSTMVGKEFVVSIPRSPQIISMERTAFNALPSCPTPVDAAFAGHTVGDPTSYPSRADTLTLINKNGGLWDGTGVTTGMSGGSTSSSADKSTSSSISGSIGTSAKVWAKGGALWMVAGFEGTFEYDYDITVATSSGTEISGTVPDLPVGSTSDKLFKYGIALYSKDLAADNPVQVVNYWVTH
jgi:hypothetical protein